MQAAALNSRLYANYKSKPHLRRPFDYAQDRLVSGPSTYYVDACVAHCFKCFFRISSVPTVALRYSGKCFLTIFVWIVYGNHILPMRKRIPLQFISRLLLMVMLTVMINGVHEGAHAIQRCVSAPLDQTLPSEISTTHQCPCSPFEQHDEYDGCDTCVSCACHAPLSTRQLEFDYNPTIQKLQTFDLFKDLPEVYLSKFIPPQNQV